jgi:Ca2+-transporting ATPase
MPFVVLVLGGVVVVNGPAYLPILPPAILYINFVTDGLPALALGVSPIEPDAMKLPPRDPTESFFSKNVLTFIGLLLLILGLSSSMCSSTRRISNGEEPKYSSS